jgi:chemotaxis protein MotB
MKDAFGVQREIPAAEIVMGVSVIKREFSPTIAEESIVEQVKQQTTDTVKENLEMKDKEKTESNDAVDPAELKEQQLKEQLEIKMIQEAKEQVEELQQALSEEIDKGQVTVEREGSRVIIRIQEKGSFKSGSASLDPEFYEVMDKITSVLVDRSGQIVVSGHTDNIPISTGRFRSNWELSSARAVTVLHAMLRNPDIDQSRVVVKGHADTKPMVENDTPENRAQNRRVELHVIKGIANDDDTQESILQN